MTKASVWIKEGPTKYPTAEEFIEAIQFDAFLQGVRDSLDINKHPEEVIRRIDKTLNDFTELTKK